MPELQIFNDGFDEAWILAVSNFPCDEENRKAFYSIKFAQAEVEGVDLNESILIDAALLNRLIDAPSHSEMRSLVTTTTKKGVVAGDFLATIYGMHSFPSAFSEPSVRKAITVAQAFAKRSHYGDGSKLSSSETAIRRCIDDFRDVAHLWGAFRLLQTFPIRPQRQMLASSEAVADFLGAAATLQDFGCTFIPKRSKPREPLLDASKIWRISDDVKRIVPPWTEPPKWLIRTVNTYKAK